MKYILKIAIIVFVGSNAFAQEMAVYDVKDYFKATGGFFVPKLSKNKMFFENTPKYKKSIVDDKIKINGDYDSVNKILYFDSDTLTKIVEKYRIEIKKTKYSKGFYLGYLVILKYFPNGKIKSYEVYCESLGSIQTDIKIGKWVKFDQNGKTMVSIDFDNLYSKHFNTILNYHDKLIDEEFKNIKMGFGIRSVSRFKNEDGKSYWILCYKNECEIIDDQEWTVIERIKIIHRELLEKKYAKNTIEFNIDRKFHEY